MKQEITRWLNQLNIPDSELVYFFVVIGLIALTSLIIHFILHRVVLRFAGRYAKRSEQLWQRALYKHKLFNRLALTLQGVILHIQAKIWLPTDSEFLPVLVILTHLWILLYAVRSLFALLNTLEDILSGTPTGRHFPVRGIFQSIKLLAAFMTVIFVISLLIGKSPLILFSGLGAMTAVLLLVFKDPILGFVAGIQLSANKMLAVGDWLEMPKYGADGDVIDISLTTVKVRNWDKTITTIPAYALISDSFKNWRGMSDAGGRRIKRSINIDASSVGFLSTEDVARLRKARLITKYMEDKLADIDAFNKENNLDSQSAMSGRRLTNLGTFRAYLTAYLRNHKDIHKDMTQMVRQLSSGPEGIPLEVYAFSSNINWVDYEGIQSDIFDHIFAVISEFGLRIAQAPTGHDILSLGQGIQAITRAPNPEPTLLKPPVKQLDSMEAEKT